MDLPVPRGEDASTGASPAGAEELVEFLLEMSDEEAGLLDQLYKATAHVRSSGGTPEQRNEAIARVLDEDPQLRDAFRALTGQDG